MNEHSAALDEIARRREIERARHLQVLLASCWTLDEVASAHRFSGWRWMEEFRTVVTVPKEKLCGL